MSQQYNKKNKEVNNGRGRKQPKQQHLQPQQQQQQQLLNHSNSNTNNNNNNANAKGTSANSIQNQTKGQQPTANHHNNQAKSTNNNKSKSNSILADVRAAESLTTSNKISSKKSNGSIPQQKKSSLTNVSNMRNSNSRTSTNLNSHQIDKERAERATLVLWRRPYTTLMYCNYELIQLTKSLFNKMLQRKLWIGMFVIVFMMLGFLYYMPGQHQLIFSFLKKNTWFVIYWTGLGILSSVGLGTGLHTFILYLGPHIASVTLAAYECNSLNFPKPPYPDDIICPEEPYVKAMPNLWSIMSKVRLEAFLWGAGTALGELPPYFMAKAARLSGYDPDDAKELAEFEALNAKRNTKNLSFMDKGKLFVERIVERIGFFGILACASIPNPLFDLAGITCGHFLVPFWTFFGATLIGKAIIKMHIQKVFVIIAFNETLIEKAVDLMSLVPLIGQKLQEPFKDFLNKQKQRLHRQRNATTESSNLLSKIFETFVICMVCYFVVSIINSFAQSYHKRLHKKTYNNRTNSKRHKKSSLRLD